jgi:spore maturation protein CgeB
MKIVIFGLSITSSWGNGHATTFRALCRALHKGGHRVVFFEKNLEWYASNRDLPAPEFCATHIYEHWEEILPRARRELTCCDVAMVGSYFPDGLQAIDEVIASRAPVKAFYDIDTPITVLQLRERGGTSYLRENQVSGFDLYFSFTGGPILREIESRFGVRLVVPLYCSFDPEQYRTFSVNKRFACDLSYMGTYAADRQPKIEEFLCQPALRLPNHRFIVAGPQYPKKLRWPGNVRRIVHLNPRWHARFYCSSRLTLNVTRRDMVLAGYSPSVRLFEAAACGAAIISDNWPGLDTFFKPGEEILLPVCSDDVVRYIAEVEEAELQQIGQRAQERVLSEHTSARRAQQFEEYVAAAASRLPTTFARELEQPDTSAVSTTP